MPLESAQVLFTFLLVTVAVQADVVSYTASATDSQPANQPMNFDDSLTIHQFDPSLGTLNSIDVTANATGILSWNMVSVPLTFYNDYIVTSFLNFMDVTAEDPQEFIDDGIFTGCGSGPYPPCPGVQTRLTSYFPVYIHGALTDGAFTFRGSPFSSDLGTLPGSLDQFIGVSDITLPISAKVFAYYGGPGVGFLDGTQQVTFNLSLDYNYTPVSPPSITPEPRWVAGLLFGLLGIARCYQARRRPKPLAV
jgi:hypothetical protein